MNKDMISGAVAGVVVSVGLLAAHMAFSAITPCMMFSAYMPQNSAVCPQTKEDEIEQGLQDIADSLGVISSDVKDVAQVLDEVKARLATQNELIGGGKTRLSNAMQGLDEAIKNEDHLDEATIEVLYAYCNLKLDDSTAGFCSAG